LTGQHEDSLNSPVPIAGVTFVCQVMARWRQRPQGACGDDAADFSHVRPCVGIHRIPPHSQPEAIDVRDGDQLHVPDGDQLHVPTGAS